FLRKFYTRCGAKAPSAVFSQNCHFHWGRRGSAAQLWLTLAINTRQGTTAKGVRQGGGVCACCGGLGGERPSREGGGLQRLPYPRRRPSGSRRSRPSLPPTGRPSLPPTGARPSPTATDAWWATARAPAPWTRP